MDISREPTYSSFGLRRVPDMPTSYGPGAPLKSTKIHQVGGGARKKVALKETKYFMRRSSESILDLISADSNKISRQLHE